MFKVIEAPEDEPVSLAEARLHLRVDDDFADDDTLISGLITAARETAEHYTGRAFASQTLEMALDSFPCALYAPHSRGHYSHLQDYIDLDQPPVSSITSIKYTDTSGAEQTLSTSAYALSLYGSAPRRVSLTYGNFWPITQCIPDAVRIRYVTGYAALPKAAKQAILLLVAHFYENRQAVISDIRAAAIEIPIGPMSLLDTIKIHGF